MPAGQFEVYPEMVTVTGGKALHPRLGVVDARNRQEPTGEFGWRYRAPNGKISAIGGEGFTRRADANRAIHDLLTDLTGADPHPPIVDLDENEVPIEVPA